MTAPPAPSPNRIPAREAARLLERSPTAYANFRRRHDQAVDEFTGEPTPLPHFDDPDAREHFYRTHVIVCPLLDGIKLPGAQWNFGRDRIERLRDGGSSAWAEAFSRQARTHSL